jgi:low affinity Fe/Cu permease
VNSGPGGRSCGTVSAVYIPIKITTMPKNSTSPFNRFFEKFANKITKATGKPVSFVLAVAVILAWGITGPLFGFSDTWQLVINTGTTIITFLMVFVIQHSQNKDTSAVQLKLNELIAASPTASNRLIVIEELTAEDLEIIKRFYVKLSELAKKETDIHKTHSIDEAKLSHEKKHKPVPKR